MVRVGRLVEFVGVVLPVGVFGVFDCWLSIVVVCFIISDCDHYVCFVSSRLVCLVVDVCLIFNQCVFFGVCSVCCLVMCVEGCVMLFLLYMCVVVFCVCCCRVLVVGVF